VVGRKIKFNATIDPTNTYDFFLISSSALVRRRIRKEFVSSETAIPISRFPGYSPKMKKVYKNNGRCV
jgi:hypothetical protein